MKIYEQNSGHEWQPREMNPNEVAYHSAWLSIHCWLAENCGFLNGEKTEFPLPHDVYNETKIIVEKGVPYIYQGGWGSAYNKWFVGNDLHHWEDEISDYTASDPKSKLTITHMKMMRLVVDNWDYVKKQVLDLKAHREKVFNFKP